MRLDLNEWQGNKLIKLRTNKIDNINVLRNEGLKKSEKNPRNEVLGGSYI